MEPVIHTYTGRRFHLVESGPEDVALEDIAHALSMLCRFTGHVRSFYSVAQHSHLVADHLPRELRLTGLLHDAAEAYLGDVGSPLKHGAGLRGYDELEDRLARVIAERFGTVYPLPAEVREADGRALATEAANLFTVKPTWFDWGQAYQKYGETERINPWHPYDAEAWFLAMASSLGVRP